MIPFPQLITSENDKANEIRKNLIQNEKHDFVLFKKIFFSNENIDLINKQLVLAVYKKSNKQFKIDFQSKESLNIIMEFIYDKYAEHKNNNIKEQIKKLNCLTVNEILPKLFTEITQRIDYLDYINNRKDLLDLPVNVNNSKILPSTTPILFSV